MDVATLNVVTGIDQWQKQTTQQYNLTKVHMQNTNEVRRTAENTEVVLRSILFYDCRLSRPQLNIWELNNQSLQSGARMSIVYQGQTYTVQTCDLVPNDNGQPHHYELGLV